MAKMVAVFFMSCALLMGAQAVHAQTPPALSLSLFRAVRLSDTSLTISFKSSQSSIGQVTYTEPDGSKVQLTDSAPQTDHLFTMNQLAPSHGYTFTITSTAGSAHSNNYVVLVSPDSIAGFGQGIVPSVQEVTASGELVRTSVAASSTPAAQKTYLPWWAFAALFVVVVGGWLWGVWKRRATAPQVPPQFEA